MLHSEDVVQKKDSNLVFRLIELGVLDGSNSDTGQDEGAASDTAAGDAVPDMPWWGERAPEKGEVHR